MSHSTTETFIQEFQQNLRNVLVENPEIETVNHLEGLPRHFLNKILAQKPLSVFIPSDYGGLGGKPAQCLSLLEAASYESIAVGLMFGINGSLFLEPVAKYGTEKAKAHVFQTFLKNESLGGLMITEPDFGTDA
ncbi:MAG: acyl-CoA dehydrogenase, partial [Desulfobacterales bacterium]|nr:acyl-CoA dehydrogenase [Desulfobacterales bacterium]